MSRFGLTIGAWAHRFFPVFCAASALAAGSGCGETAAPEETSSTALVLRQRFPGQAPRVLEVPEGFVRTARGFVTRGGTNAGGWRRVEVELPRNGEEAIRVRAAGGFEARVREVGLTGEATEAEGAVAYRRQGGRSFWTIAGAGAEEWLHVGAGLARSGEVIAAWEVEGAARVELQGKAVGLFDEAGVARVWVTAPEAYAVGGREVETRLWVNGGRIELSVEAEGEEVLVDPVWQAGAPMFGPRLYHTATLLDDGRVLVAGGTAQGFPDAEVYDPSQQQWHTTLPMQLTRAHHTATLLENGKVLVVGGSSSNGMAVSSAELYDPATKLWSQVSPMSAARMYHTATRLSNGNVLVAGGTTNGEFLASAEVYNPATDAWSNAGTMSVPRWSSHTGTLLANGKVLVVGGVDAWGGSLNTDLYDPFTNSWSTAGSLAGARYYHAATLLGNGKVLVAGGYNEQAGVLYGTEIYDPATNEWFLGTPMTAARANAETAVLDTGDVLIVGGRETASAILASAEIYQVVTATWTPAGVLSIPRYQHRVTMLGNGRVLVTGGYAAVGPLHTTEVYQYAQLGQSCMWPDDCQSGFCVDGVCCENACDGGACEACSVAAGAPADGTCAPLTGASCSDGDGCTQGDTCQSGTCTPGPRKNCFPYTCDAGACLVTCEDDTQCVDGAYCVSGICNTDIDTDGAKGTSDNCPTDANPLQTDTDGDGFGDVCEEDDDDDGLVDAADNCSLFANPGQEDADADGTGDVCDCDAPKKEDGAPCDDRNACTRSDTCKSGSCVGSSEVVCNGEGACQQGQCNPMNAVCFTAQALDNTPCPGGVCIAGGCYPEAVGSSTGSNGDSGSGSGGSSGDASGSGTGTGAANGGTSASGGSENAGEATDPSLRGGGCGCRVGTTGATRVSWLGLGLLVVALRQCRRPLNRALSSSH